MQSKVENLGDLKAIMANPLFAGMSEEEVAVILKSASINEYAEGTVLVEKGSKPDHLILVIDGTISIYNEDVLLAEVGSDAVLGESFLAGTTATATLISGKGMTVCCCIRKEVFMKLSKENPQLILNLFTISHHRLRQSNENTLKAARMREQDLERQVAERTAELNSAMTDLKKTNLELTDTRDKLIETEKFRQQFLANMSHEIRTPMNAIVGLTNLLLKSEIDDQQDKYLNVISKSGANLLVIINDILDLAKIEAGKMELETATFDLHAALGNVHTILNLKAEEKGVALHTEIDEEVPQHIVGDETRLVQIIMNLTGNAIKFTEKGSVNISITKSDNRYRFSVRDTGIGIPADRLEKIFESFGQAESDTTRKFGGTGLGLTISRQLVELHNGRLLVTSEYGSGSDFFFEIDLVKGEPEKNTSDDMDIDPEKIAQLKILLVEDNEFNQMVAVDTLQDLFPGISVDVADNGELAIARIRENEYDFVFMDIQMPGMNGYETTRQIREKLKDGKEKIRICAMTANVTKDEIQACYDAGMDDYMMKPYTPEQLREKVISNGMRIPDDH